MNADDGDWLLVMLSEISRLVCKMAGMRVGWYAGVCQCKYGSVLK